MAVRKTVTVLFSDIVGSTALGETFDAEVLTRVLRRYFDEVRSVLEQHGGRVEKFIGDAVLAVFGVPTAREDDALRALRSAAEIRERLELLNEDFERELGIRLRVRTGIATGEVLVSESSGDGLTASGDTMNVAARLEQTASADEILIGMQTRVLGGDAIVVEELAPLDLKGKSQPVHAFRLLRVLPHASPYGRRDDAPLVGRQQELATLQGALLRVIENAECGLGTVVGAAGVGKSRLVREFLAGLDASIRVLVGRCAPYGEGITFLPLAQALEPVLGANARSAVLKLLAGDERREAVADHVAAAFGAEAGIGSGEETFWAFRRLFEGLARDRPLVLVVDDIHWAEATLLDLLEYVTSSSSDARIVILCLTRPELLEERPTWSTPRGNSIIVVLTPLADDESLVLAQHLSPERELAVDDLRRIVDAADGNPLFLEQLLALNSGSERGAKLVIPPTIQALLAARIDRLDQAERTVLRSAAVEGREFRRGAVVELLPPEAREGIGSVLVSLSRRQFIRPSRAGDTSGDAFSFAHGLLREAAYAETPKETRANLHLRLAEYLEQDPSMPVELVGHHLAEAAGYQVELGRDDDVTRDLAARAVAHLAAGGQHALGLGDDRAAAKLLERACELVPRDDPSSHALRFELGRALAGSGRLEQAQATLAEVAAAAHLAGERALELRAELGLLNLRAQTDAQLSMFELEATAESALPELERLGDERGLASAWWLVHWARFRIGRYADSLAAAEQTVEHAHRAGDRREELRALGAIAMATCHGPTSVTDGLRRCDELVERAGGASLVEAFAARVRGFFLAMTGEFERGRAECRRSVEIYEELGNRVSALGVVCELELVERKSGRLEVAEEELRSADARLREIGDVGYLSWVVPQLARILALQGKIDEAVELARRSRAEMQPDHAFGQVTARLAEAIAFTRGGQLEAAEGVALEALELVERTDALDVHADLLLALADIDRARGRTNQASARVLRAIELSEKKGDMVSVAHARSLV